MIEVSKLQLGKSMTDIIAYYSKKFDTKKVLDEINKSNEDFS